MREAIGLIPRYPVLIQPLCIYFEKAELKQQEPEIMSGYY